MENQRNGTHGSQPDRYLIKHLARTKLASASRRRFLLQGLAMLAGGSGLAFKLRPTPSIGDGEGATPVRPPTANRNDEIFRQQCVRCGLCGLVCENGCIRFFGGNERTWGRFTPYLHVRTRSCTLCMRCTEVCPSGALVKTSSSKAVVAKEIKMGVAVVEPDLCISYLGRVCGYCHDACPLPGQAIRLLPPATPEILLAGCVGCGRCVEYCPQTPTAIKVDTTSSFSFKQRNPPPQDRPA